MVFGEPSLALWLIRLSVLSAIAYLSTRFSHLPTSLLAIVATISCVTPLALSWLLTVTENVPEPYLVRTSWLKFRRASNLTKSLLDQDEVFHVPQAQVYCEGKYLEWDDKITTPPGL